MKIIKQFTYNVVNTEPFDIPLPLEFELMHANALLASYKVHENGQVDYQFSTKANEKILTSTLRPLELNDIYFLFSQRVFPDKKPFTQTELERFGVVEYNPYEIARKTRGILAADRYWIKFEGEELSYKQAVEQYNEFFSDASKKKDESTASVKEKGACGNPDAIFSLEAIMEQKSHEYSSINDVGSILGQSKLDVSALAASIDNSPITESAFAPGKPPRV
jgi:hypothetical protein